MKMHKHAFYLSWPPRLTYGRWYSVFVCDCGAELLVLKQSLFTTNGTGMYEWER